MSYRERLPEYVRILNAYGPYEGDGDAAPFVYEHGGGLQDLREAYRLDAVAGDGDEIARLANVARWVSDSIPYDGNSVPPEEKNALAILAAARAHGTGANCWLLAVVVLHVGGVYEDPAASLERFVRRYEALPPAVRRRVVLENDDRRYDWGDVWQVHERTGVPLVLDVLHHQVHNRQRIALRQALAAALSSWPSGVTPKLHFSTPRTDVRSLEGSGRLKLPTWTEHADFCNPFAFIDLLSQLDGLPDTDIMLEAKARDVALLKLREDVARFAPEWRDRLL